MKFLSVVKRVAPFIVALALGLFVASFFVTVSAPNFKFRRGAMHRHREYDRQREMRLNQLEAEKERLTRRVQELEKRDWVLQPDFEVAVPPPPPAMPMKTVPYKPSR